MEIRSTSDSSKLSTNSIEFIIERLQANQNRQSTTKNYMSIWRQLNAFLLRLDVIPEDWEDRVALFLAYLIEFKKLQSSTVRSYASAIKHILKCDKYEWDERRIWLNALIRACKKENDVFRTRLPIGVAMLETILFEVGRYFANQPYLESLYKAMFALAYYGLMRVGEITKSPHCIKAKDIFIADNKNKIKLVLFSSKTHNAADRPQEIKISTDEAGGVKRRNFCPFELLRSYMHMRGTYAVDEEEFFVFSDGSPVMHTNLWNCLKLMIKCLDINADCYNVGSMRSGRATDLLKFGYTVEEIKRMGRWKSNAVYKYFRSF